MRLCRAFYHFFATSFINLIVQEQDCKILFIVDNKTTLKSHFLVRKDFDIYTRLCYGHHYITICRPLLVYRFKYMKFYHSQMRRHVIKLFFSTK